MAAPVLALRDVRLADGSRWLFDGVDLALEPRARACLVGRNGAGKSTLLRILADLTAPDSGDRFVNPGLKVALVAQEPQVDGASLLDFATVGGAARHEAEAELVGFGLDPRAGAENLSGGEARRACLARAFAEAPDVLLLDEPTNHLDIVAIELLETRLARSRAAMLIVSHDRAFLERITRRCYWLEDRRVRRLDAGFAAFDAWSEKIANVEARADRRLQKTIEREQDWMAFGVTARRARNEGRRRRLIALRAEKAERLRLARGEFSVAAPVVHRSAKRVIEAKNISKAYGGRSLLAGFSTLIQRGDRVAVIGRNGAGKTTLVKILLGEIAPDAGSVRLGPNLAIAYVDQARSDLAAQMSLAEALVPHGGDQVMVQGQPRHVAAYARDFLFREDQMRQPVASLSGGERNRLLLARALARPSNVLVLDEPTNDLDMETLDLLEDMLADYSGVLILVSHDRDFIDRLATSTIALDGRGRAIETSGGWSDFHSQNPDFLAQIESDPPAKRAIPPPTRAAARPAKLSFKDQRRLAELEARMPELGGEVAKLRETLADASFYGRDAAAFAEASRSLARAQAELSSAEEAWLALEARRESLLQGR
jgi:ATP-binding cassette subfamily F protein uup